MANKKNILDHTDDDGTLELNLGRDADWEQILRTYMDGIRESNPKFFDTLLLVFNEYSKTDSSELQPTACYICSKETFVTKEVLKEKKLISCTQCFINTVQSSDLLETDDFPIA